MLQGIKAKFYAYIFIFVFLGAGALRGQSYQGGIRGTVTDAQSAAVAGAKVTLTEEATNISRATITDGAGEYVFNTVDPAAYSIVVESPNFKRYEHRDVSVATGQVATVDIQLQLGTVSQSV